MAESIKIVENNLLINCPLSKYNINISEDIWEPNLVSLKGKTVKQQPTQVRKSVIPLLLSISQKYNHIALCADVMKLSTIPLLLYINKHLYL